MKANIHSVSVRGYVYDGRYGFQIVDCVPIADENASHIGDIVGVYNITGLSSVIEYSTTTAEEINSERYIVEKIIDPDGEDYDDRISISFVAVLPEL